MIDIPPLDQSNSQRVKVWVTPVGYVMHSPVTGANLAQWLYCFEGR